MDVEVTSNEQQGDGYTVYFGRGNRDTADIIDRAAATAGMRRSVADCAAAGIAKRWHHRLIRMAGPSEAVVFSEQVLERDGQVVARLLTVERWRRTAEGWRVVREKVEPVAP